MTSEIAPHNLAEFLRDIVDATSRSHTTIEEMTRNGFHTWVSDVLEIPGVSSSFMSKAGGFISDFLEVPLPPKEPARPRADAGEEAWDRYRNEMQMRDRHKELYDLLFSARSLHDAMELVVGVCLLTANSNQFCRHLVVVPAEVELDTRSGILKVVTTDLGRVEKNWLDGANRLKLLDSMQQLENLQEVITYEELEVAIQDLIHSLGTRAKKSPQRISPKDSSVFGLGAHPALMMRKKDTSSLLSLLESLADSMKDEHFASEPFKMLLSPTYRPSQLESNNDFAALPLPANSNQRAMIDRTRTERHLVIQGPPGTGKTHTIANLASALMAEGRRILITAENEHALREVQGKLPEKMQPLMLPFFRERKSTALELSVNGILERAGTADSIDRLDRQISEASARLKQAQGEIADLEASLIAISDRDKEERSLNGATMRIEGHLRTLRDRKQQLDLADRFLNPELRVNGDVARDYLDLHEKVTEEHLGLSKFVYPAELPEVGQFSTVVQDFRSALAVLPDRKTFDHAALASQVDSLERLCSTLQSLPLCDWYEINQPASIYVAALEDLSSISKPTAVPDEGLTFERVQNYISLLEIYLDLDETQFDSPLNELIARFQLAQQAVSRSSTTASLKSNGPIKDLLPEWERALALLERDKSGLLHEFVHDNQERGFGRVAKLIPEAVSLFDGARLSQGRRVTIQKEGLGVYGLARQARGLRDHLKGGGKFSKVVGVPGPVKEAKELLENVLIGGDPIQSLEDVERALAYLVHLDIVQQAKEWGTQHSLRPPSDNEIPEWLQAIAAIPDSAVEIDQALASAREQLRSLSILDNPDPASVLKSAIAAAYVQTRDVLEPLNSAFEKLRNQPSSRYLNPDSRREAIEALQTLNWAKGRLEGANILPRSWVDSINIYQVDPTDKLRQLLDLASIASEVPTEARMTSLSPTSVRSVIDQANADSRRKVLLGNYESFINAIIGVIRGCVPASPAAQSVSRAAENGDAKLYRESLEQLNLERAKAQTAISYVAAREALLEAHIQLVHAHEAGDASATSVLNDLDDFQNLLNHRTNVEKWRSEIGTSQDIHLRLAVVNRTAQEAETKLADGRAWRSAALRLQERRELSSSLAHLKTAIAAVPRTQTAKSYPRRLQAVRMATRDAQPAIPCWVMTIDRVAEILNDPAAGERFDVIIVDESSQAWFPAIFLYALANQVIVVGDDLQTSPARQILRDEDLISVARQHIPRHRIANLVGDDLSLYDVAMSMSGPETMIDHFRCVPEIIDISNRLAYEPTGKRLLASRTRQPNSLEPIAHIRVEGQRYPNGPNEPEIEAILQEVISCHNDPRYRNKTFGVVVVGSGPNAHIKRLKSMLLEELGPTALAERKLEVGTPSEFQGAERHVIFLSMLDVPEDGKLMRLNRLEYTGQAKRFVQQLNVAVSRAQDQLFVVRSFDESQLKSEDARLVLLSTRPTTASSIQNELLKCDSQFERDVIQALAAREPTLRIRAQVEAIGYSIDIVVEDAKGNRLAVECDGDRWHTTNPQIKADLYRQRTLENIGWRFHRFLSSEWYGDPDHHVSRIIEEVSRSDRKPK